MSNGLSSKKKAASHEATAPATTPIGSPLPSFDVLKKMKVADLKKLCVERGITALGTKDIILAQLMS